MSKKIKILHVSDMHFRHNGRLYYSTTRKLNNGFILNGCNVLHISDRDITNEKKNIFDIGSTKYLLKKIIENIKNFKPDLIIFGHVDRLKYIDFLQLKQSFQNIIFSQWFIDPLGKYGPDYEKNKERFFLKYQFCDSNFLTTSPDALDFVDKNCYYIPNAVDPSIDVLQNYKYDNDYDIFLAVSHGVHRGILKRNFYDHRIEFIKKLTKKSKNNIFGHHKNPIWGSNFFEELSKCNMGINLTRGKAIKYASSERMASLLGNGLLTFEHASYGYQDFFKKDEMIFYKNIDDLNSKILFYKKHNNLRKKIAYKGYIKSHRIFNNKIVSEYIINKSIGLKFNKDYIWNHV